MEYKQHDWQKDKIKGKLTKTNKIILGDNGNHNHTYLKRRLYSDEKGHLFAKYFDIWWSHTNKEIEHYGVVEK